MPSDTKTRERTEGAAATVQVNHGDNCSANQIDSDPMCLTSFGDDSTGPPALPYSRDDSLVDNDAAAPKSCLSSLEIRTPIDAGGLLPTGKASTTTRDHLLPTVSWFCPTEETNSERTSIQYASYYIIFWWINNQVAAPSWRRVIQHQGKL